MQLKNIRLLLSVCPVHISRPYRQLPHHWKSNQKASAQPKTLGEQIKKHRLELCWLQRDVAAKIGISFTTLSNWERGVTSPSRKMRKKIREFLHHNTFPTLSKQLFDCQLCGISEISRERCLFESACKRLNKNGL